VGGTGALVLTADGEATPGSAAGPHATPAPTPVAAVAGATGDVVPWDRPLRVQVSDGTLTFVSATGPDGLPFEGRLTPTSWTSTATLIPRAAYRLHVELRNADGVASSYDRELLAAPARQELRATVLPRSGTYGVGQPVIVRFNHAVKTPEQRRAVMARLTVTTAPVVQGAWRWYSAQEVHFHGPELWKPGTVVRTTADLTGLRLPGSKTWGADGESSGRMTIGDAVVSTVDLETHLMTVKRNGKVVRVMKISGGKAAFPSLGGTHIVLDREREHLFNSATIGIPTASPEGYYKKLPWAVRITNSGTFVHANAGTVRHQGVRNVSHGCINASPEDAQWFYELSHLGDVVKIVNAVVGPNRWDAGSTDWNYSWEEWQEGNLS
jgi:lipoprotein-anchoring transpeptidase ErfK/SrfK